MPLNDGSVTGRMSSNTPTFRQLVRARDRQVIARYEADEAPDEPDEPVQGTLRSIESDGPLAAHHIRTPTQLSVVEGRILPTDRIERGVLVHKLVLNGRTVCRSTDVFMLQTTYEAIRQAGGY